MNKEARKLFKLFADETAAFGEKMLKNMDVEYRTDWVFEDYRKEWRDKCRGYVVRLAELYRDGCLDAKEMTFNYIMGGITQRICYVPDYVQEVFENKNPMCPLGERVARIDDPWCEHYKPKCWRYFADYDKTWRPHIRVLIKNACNDASNARLFYDAIFGKSD